MKLKKVRHPNLYPHLPFFHGLSLGLGLGLDLGLGLGLGLGLCLPLTEKERDKKTESVPSFFGLSFFF